jgi:hypothetical protein
LIALPKVRRTYKVNINHLFDQDELHLYENDHFNALIRRIHTKYHHLVNPDFEIGKELLKEDPKYDKWFEEIDQMNNLMEPKKEVDYFYEIQEQVNGTFNLSNFDKTLGLALRDPYNTMMSKYEDFFTKETDKLNHDLNKVIE